ncbi:uncharacterized protein DUF4209 [Kribbella sp. VKM Ac-2569]|uniref:DUF4209 domain-containing protein n=1 Tax=Kribbella sp. VKM Ac-2569 TaxID=2512220 RepID=UPI00102C136F|nr:DUF4209 domain-containing protein [Kribbella sp. VKM Ac-2569]RZT17463.1 uncharacterized protein DUF4209 [Kribbella sp. VKM Ac-2569]
MTVASPEPDADEPDDGDSASLASADPEGVDTEVPEPAPIPAYVFDDAHLPIATDILDAAFTDLHLGPVGWGLVEQAAAKRPDLDPTLVRELSLIASRDLRLARRGEVGCEFWLDGKWLPDPRNVSTDVVSLWVACAESVTSTGARARLEELLIARREGNVGQRARTAAASYLATVIGKDDELTLTIQLSRAWTIARKYSVTDVEDQVLDEILIRVESISPAHPGSLLPLVAILCHKPSSSARAEDLRTAADKLLTRLAKVLTRDHLAAEVADLRLSLLHGPDADEARLQIRRDQLTALRLATTVAGLHPAVRQHHLAIAAEFATRHNFKTELRQIRAELESIPVEDLGLIRFSQSVPIPRQMPEYELQPFTRGHLWQDALGYFLHTGPPTGSVDDLRARASSGRSGLLSILPTQLLGHGGLPRVTLATEEAEVEHRMSEHAKVIAQTVGSCYAEGLMRLADRYGTPTLDDLQTYFVQQYKCNPAGAFILAKAYRMFWNGDYIDAVHLVIPAAEAAARRLLRMLDEGIYKVAVGNSVGEYPGFRVLLEELDTLALDPSWSWFLKWIFLGPIGLNLRNDVAHGFIVGIDPAYAALVLRAASLLITTTTTIDGERPIISVPSPPAPRPGIRGVGDRLIRTASSALLRGHVRLEAIRRRPTQDPA